MMDYQKAIEALQFEGGIGITGNPRKAAEFFDGLDVAIFAMKELQLYKDGKLCLIPESVYSKQCDELDTYKQIGTLEEVREAVDTVRRYETQYLDDMENPLEPLKISSALKSEIMKLEFRKQRKPESISIFDYTIIAALQKVLKEVGGES